MAYYPFWNLQYLVFFDIPLFLLFFGLSFLLIRFVLKLQDPIGNSAAAAFSAGLAYFIVRSYANLYYWMLWHWTTAFGLIIVFIIFGLAFFMVKTKL